MRIARYLIPAGILASVAVGIIILCLTAPMIETHPKLGWSFFGLSVGLMSLGLVLYALAYAYARSSRGKEVTKIPSGRN